MASQRQIAANRRNAKQSTGPQSSEGKARSRHNALTHGLTARQVLLPHEDSVAYDELCQAMVSSLAPEDALEHQLVEQAASLVWRLRRVPAFEVALFAWMTHFQANYNDRVGSYYDGPDTKLRRLPEKFADTDGHNSATPDVLEIGRTLEALFDTDLTSKLSRYETSLQRQLSLILKELRELKAMRPNHSKRVEAAE